jgi:hypothetical protein
MISRVALPLFGLQSGHDRLWEQLHHLGSDACVILIGLHLGLHWNWIVHTTRRLFTRGNVRRAGPSAARAASEAREIAR